MRRLKLVTLFILATATAMAQTVVHLPGTSATLECYTAEQCTAASSDNSPRSALRPTLSVVVCPGGSYSWLDYQVEGVDVARWLQAHGISAYVLRYRVQGWWAWATHYRLLFRGHKYPDPLHDAETALDWLAAHSDSLGINPDGIGIMGFSAGGHLASTIATHSVKDAKPNFQILFYPVITMMPDITHKGSHDNLLGNHARTKLEREYSNDMQVSRLTPRAWIALSDDDHAVLPANGVSYYQACYKQDVPASLHVYPTGGHGWGMRSSFKYHIEMLLELKAWLQSF